MPRRAVDERGVELGAGDDARVRRRRAGAAARPRGRSATRARSRAPARPTTGSGAHVEPERLEEAQRAGGEAVAAGLVAGEAGLVDARARRGPSRRGLIAGRDAGGPGAHDEHVEHRRRTADGISHRRCSPTAPTFRRRGRGRCQNRSPARTAPRPRRATPRTRSAMNVVVCVKQIPDPAVPGALDADHTLDRERQADPRRVRQLRRRDGAAARRHGRRRRGHARSRWRRTTRCRACAPRSRWARPRRSSCPTTRSPAPTRCRPPRCSPSASSAPATSTSCSPRPSRPTATPARSRRRSRELLGWPSLTFAKHVEIADGKVKIQRQTEAGYDDGRGVAARGRERDRRCGRAALPVVQGDHGGEEQAGRPGDRGRPRPRRRRRSVGPARARRSRTSTQAPARQAGEKIEDDGDRRPRRSSRSSSS